MTSQSGETTYFSIVIPTFNSATTLAATLESIAMQGWPLVEVVIIDGVSRDNTLEIARAFSELKLVIVSEPDNGIYDAINKGISISNGELVCVIGSDDLLAPGALGAVSRVWKDSLSDIVAGRALLLAPDGTSTMRVDENYDIGCLISGIPFCHNSMYVTREAYSRVGSYATNLRICADAEWVHRSIRSGCSCTRIPDVLVHFSLDGTSSRNDELIMAETYSVVAANFPGLSVAEAEILFKAARGWTDATRVAAVVAQHSAHSSLRNTAEVKFGVSIFGAPEDNTFEKPHPIQSSRFAKAIYKIREAFLSSARGNRP